MINIIYKKTIPMLGHYYALAPPFTHTLPSSEPSHPKVSICSLFGRQMTKTRGVVSWHILSHDCFYILQQFVETWTKDLKI
jgi:hypothetical protein